MGELDRARQQVERVAKLRDTAKRETASGAQVAHGVDVCFRGGGITPEVQRYLHAVRELAEASEVVEQHCGIAAARAVLEAMRDNAVDAVKAAERHLEAAERALYQPRGQVSA